MAIRWDPRPHQIDMAEQAKIIIDKHKLVYLAAEERTGKSITGLLIAETMSDSTLIITKKKAMDGWSETLHKCRHWLKAEYTISSYHSVSKAQHPEGTGWPVVIIDEAHSYISAYPMKKATKIWRDVKLMTNSSNIIYMSATPYAQGIQLLYHQFAISRFSPWRIFSSFYDWHRFFGIPNRIKLPGRFQETYKKVKTPEVWETVKHLFITKTRVAIGFKHEPEDILHYIDLKSNVVNAYNSIMKHKCIEFEIAGIEYLLVADTSMKLRTSLHMLEGGVLKIKGEYILLGNREKIDFILAKWGDTDDIVIMHQYTAERIKLSGIFNNALILQATSYAEGIDLSHKKHLIIYSQDFSTAKHTQRRARQANQSRTTDIKVHFLLVKKGISDQVYTTVSKNKVNFVDSLFRRENI